MGVIARQGSKRTIVSFIGVFIGVLSMLFIYPNDMESYGLALFLFSMANLLMIILSAGSLGLIVRYFPVFQKEKIKGFISAILVIVFATVIITSILLFFLKEPFYALLDKLDFKVEQIKDHSIYIYIITILLVFIHVLNYQASNFKRIVVPAILFDLGYKIMLPVLVLLVFLGTIDLPGFEFYYTLFFVIVLILLIFYVSKLGGLQLIKPDFSGIKQGLRKEMRIYMFYSASNQIGASIVSRVDVLMVSTLISFSSNGAYGILLIMANVIDVPVKSINQIAAPVISSSIENKDRENVSSIYRKSSLNSLLSGFFIFVLIWGLLNDLFNIMPNGEVVREIKNVFLFLGIGKLVDMAFSTNTHIIIYSKYFRYNLFFVLFLAILNLVLNYFFITSYGLVGAAIATAISLISYNILKLLFIKVKMDYWPFSLETLKVFVTGMLTFILCIFLPNIFSNFLDILIKGAIIAAVYYTLLKLFRVKAEILNEVDNILQLTIRRFR